jgi:hypothetical protein
VQERARLVESRKQAHREVEAASPTAHASKPGRPWEGVASLLDFKAAGPASDVSRLRSLLLMRKAIEQQPAAARQ